MTQSASKRGEPRPPTLWALIEVLEQLEKLHLEHQNHPPDRKEARARLIEGSEETWERKLRRVDDQLWPGGDPVFLSLWSSWLETGSWEEAIRQHESPIEAARDLLAAYTRLTKRSFSVKITMSRLVRQRIWPSIEKVLQTKFSDNPGYTVNTTYLGWLLGEIGLGSVRDVVIAYADLRQVERVEERSTLSQEGRPLLTARFPLDRCLLIPRSGGAIPLDDHHRIVNEDVLKAIVQNQPVGLLFPPDRLYGRLCETLREANAKLVEFQNTDDVHAFSHSGKGPAITHREFLRCEDYVQSRMRLLDRSIFGETVLLAATSTGVRSEHSLRETVMTEVAKEFARREKLNSRWDLIESVLRQYCHMHLKGFGDPESWTHFYSDCRLTEIGECGGALYGDGGTRAADIRGHSPGLSAEGSTALGAFVLTLLWTSRKNGIGTAFLTPVGDRLQPLCFRGTWTGSGSRRSKATSNTILLTSTALSDQELQNLCDEVE